jgi:PTH1 family peptidyl-tRNA hydrolase
MAIKLMVGLGNPGPEYAMTRHNAGAWLVEAITQQAGHSLRFEAKFQGVTGNIILQGHSCRLLIPTTFMNRSGQSIRAMANFYQLSPEEILVIHDELDITAGLIRLKFDGGHGGHNGLRDTIAHLQTGKFWRLRVGISHPGDSKLVSDYVLNRPSRDEQLKISSAIDDGIRVLPLVLAGETDKAMKELHT